MTAYYNEIDPYAAAWLRNLIAAGHIVPGEVDERSIVDVRPSDLDGFDQCHFFAGLGGWPYACRLAGWPDDRRIWTGSCPCQGESVAGKRLGKDDPRHLWPAWFPLIAARRPAVVMGEQVARAAGTHWLDGVCSDMESIGYAVRAAVVPASAVGAPHRRDRLWFVADTDGIARNQGRQDHSAQGSGGWNVDRGGVSEDVADPLRDRWQGRQSADQASVRRRPADPGSANVADASGARLSAPECHELRGKGRRQEVRAAAERGRWPAEPGVGRVAHGVSARVGRLRAYGNAIVPQVAAEVIGAYLDAL